MQVRELVAVAQFLQKFIAEKQLVQEYQNLVNAVNQAAQNQNLDNFKAVLGRVRSVHEQAEEAVHSPAEHQLLVEYGADKLLGRTALARIDSIFDDNQANPPALLAAIWG